MHNVCTLLMAIEDRPDDALTLLRAASASMPIMPDQKDAIDAIIASPDDDLSGRVQKVIGRHCLGVTVHPDHAEEVIGAAIAQFSTQGD